MEHLFSNFTYLVSLDWVVPKELIISNNFPTTIIPDNAITSVMFHERLLQELDAYELSALQQLVILSVFSIISLFVIYLMFDKLVRLFKLLAFWGIWVFGLYNLLQLQQIKPLVLRFVG